LSFIIFFKHIHPCRSCKKFRLPWTVKKIKNSRWKSDYFLNGLRGARYAIETRYHSCNNVA